MHPARLSALSAAHFALRALPRFIAPIERSDFWAGIGQLSLPPSSLPLITDPSRSPWVRTLDVPPQPFPLPPQLRLDFGRRVRRHAHPAEPACSGLHLRSVLRFAIRLLPRTASRRQAARLTTGRSACSCPSSRLLPTRSVKDFHLQSSAHARHTSVSLRFTSRAPLGNILKPWEEWYRGRSSICLLAIPA